jgi:hypothetical protein
MATRESNSTAAINAVKDLLIDTTKLRTPAIAAGVAAVVLELIPGIRISGVAVAGILTGIGTGAEYIENFIWHKTVAIVSSNAVAPLEVKTSNQVKTSEGPAVDSVVKVLKAQAKTTEEEIASLKKKPTPKKKAPVKKDV